jgi:adenine specific DNA methylase Mod
MKVQYNEKPNFLVVTIIGQWTTSGAIKSIEEIKLEAEKTGRKKILLNLLELSAPDSELVRYDSGKKIAESLAKYKVAAFSQPEKINYLGEITATNRGANFKMFVSEQAATQWLLDD